MRALVTGGAGFIGSHFADDLVLDGHEILVVDDLSHGREEQIPPGARWERMDLRSPRLESLVGAFKPDLVYHFAAQIDVQKSFQDVLLDADQNILGSLRLLEACRLHGVGHFYFASSGGGIYGEPGAWGVDEVAPVRPASPYGVAKLAFEGYLDSFHRRFGLPSTSLRFSNVYGPRQGTEGEAGVVAMFMSTILRGKPATIFGDGLQTRDFVFVKDLVKAGRLLRTHPCPGVLNLGTGLETTILELHQAIQAVLGVRVAPEFAPSREGEQRRSVLDCTKASRLIGWRAESTLSQGLGATLDWFRSRSS